MENASLTLQSLASFTSQIFEDTVSCTSQKQECTNTDTISEQRNAFIVLMAEGRGMSENSSINIISVFLYCTVIYDIKFKYNCIID